MSELTFQSPLELIFKNGSWKSLSIDPDELELRRKLLPVFDDENVENWDFTSQESLQAYEDLSKLLKSGDHDRFLLYCPVQIIPHVSYYRTCSSKIDNFIELYLAAFYRLCTVYDVRANFIDGDVPDIELSDRSMEEVVQIAYLVPDLITKELISKSNISLYLTDPAFLRAISDVTSDREPEELVKYDINYDDFTNSIIKCFVYYADLDGDFSISAKRAEWLRTVKNAKIVKQLAKAIDLDKITKHQNLTIVDSVIAATIDYNITTLNKDNQTIRKWLKYLSIFNNMDYVHSLLCRLDDCGFVFDKPSNFKIQKLEGDYDDPKLIKSGKCHFDICGSLSEHIFPVVILYGSKLKGYGANSSDTDVAVVMLPGATQESVKIIHEKFGDKVLKFFTQYNEINCTLEIKNGDQRDPTVGCDTDSHVLFNGLWIGQDDVISHLVSHLLTPVKNHHQRIRHLAELEKDLLQYRLLHKGYERFRVVSSDVDRTYFDVGYRCLASRLYLNKIFNVTTKLVG